MTDRLFEESNEERIARLRRRFETGVERAESAHKKLELVDGRLRHIVARQAELRTQIDAIVADLEGDAAGHERNVQETHTASSEVQS